MLKPLKHKINPQVDCIFKAILGANKNKGMLLNFLNSILNYQQPIVSVDIINPYNEQEFLTDKLTIVDVKAKDSAGCQYQIEIQMANHKYLAERIVYTWSDIYGSQLDKGENYTTLNPVVSIWLLVDDLFEANNDEHTATYHHHFQLADINNKRLLSNHCSIHVLELNKWQQCNALNSSDHWLYFFKEAQNWTELPSELNTPAMRQAMSILQGFSEKERDYHLYQSRQNALRVESTRQQCLEDIELKLIESTHKLVESTHKLAESTHKLAESTHKLAESEHDLAESEHNLTESEHNLTESEHNLTESRSKLTESEQKIAQLVEQLRVAGLKPK